MPEAATLLEDLVALAREAGLEVREAGASGEPPESGVCRVRGGFWIVLSKNDPLETRMGVLVGALRQHAGPWLESRYLPPALRERLEADT